MPKRKEISLLGTIAFCAVIILIRQLLKADKEERKIEESGKVDIPGL